ncbi:PepSY domain-containing protein [Candidatus Woesearchaeota archaeon]|nr:PepSY domain-containing protein [Candidatus Woesearchaeota archaeon]
MKKLLIGLLFVALMQLSVVAASHSYITPDTGSPVTVNEAVTIATTMYPTRGDVVDTRLELGTYKGSTTRVWRISLLSDNGSMVTHVIVRQETGQILRVASEFNRGNYGI